MCITAMATTMMTRVLDLLTVHHVLATVEWQTNMYLWTASAGHERDIIIHVTSIINTKSKPVRGCVEYLGDGLQHQVEQVAAEGVPGGGGVVAQAEEVEPPTIQNV